MYRQLFFFPLNLASGTRLRVSSRSTNLPIALLRLRELLQVVLYSKSDSIFRCGH